MALSITDKSWKEAKRKNGFVIYTKQVAGYETKMFKLDATFENVKIAKIAGIIRDADKTEDWISDVIEGELISKTSDDKWLSYLLFDLPWPLDQREMALDHDITTNTPEEVFIKLTVNNKTPQKE
ncbi:MAG: hypothetical protein JKY53_14195, partial [Flavobacteriales bacterium]|nr:hypothetical protein [Flavobacteriales bacterium]